MLISNAKKFIFIETPKTASSSMRSILERFEDEEHGYPKHMPARGAVEKMGEERWKEFHSFAVMREPVSWLHSWYKFWRGLAKNGKLPENRLSVLELSFEDFLAQAAVQKRHEPFGRIGLQSSRFCDARRKDVVVSRLIRFEALPEELEKLKADLDLTDLPDMPRRNVSKDDSTLPELEGPLRMTVRKRWKRDFLLYEQLTEGALA